MLEAQRLCRYEAKRTVSADNCKSVVFLGLLPADVRDVVVVVASHACEKWYVQCPTPGQMSTLSACGAAVTICWLTQLRSLTRQRSH